MNSLLNDKIIPYDQASLHVSDLSILRGVGIFDFFRLRGHMPLFMDDHLDRFFYSAEKVYGALWFSRAWLREQIVKLIGLNNMPESGIRIVLTGGYSADAYTIEKPNLIITQEPIKFPRQEHYQEGVKLITHNYTRDLPEIKTINYLVGISLQKEIAKEGAYDVLYHEHGKVSELTRSNIFFITIDDQLVTPKINILKGVTRKKVIQLAENHMAVCEKDITLEELPYMKEAFLTGTTKKILPVTQVDNITIGQGVPGSATLKLMSKFEQLVDQEL